MIIAIDFDGTLVEHKYPEIGEDVPLAFETLKDLQNDGHELILWTMRCGVHLNRAVEYCKHKGIDFIGVNYNPSQKGWSDSPKAYAQIYIDDAALGCPLVDALPRRYVDWGEVRLLLCSMGIDIDITK